MKKHNLNTAIVALAGVAAFCSCEIKFDVVNDAEPIAFIQCIPEQDTIMLRINYADAVKGNSKDTINYEPAEMTIKLNGQSLEVKKCESKSITYENAWYAVHHLDPADKVEIRAGGNGVPVASGQTTIPAAPVLKNVKFEAVNIGGDYTGKVTLNLGEEPKEGEFYGLKIKEIAYTEYTQTGGDEEDMVSRDTTIRFRTPEYDLNLGSLSSLDLDDMAEASYSNHKIDLHTGEDMVLIPGKKFKGSQYSFMLYAYSNDCYEYEYDDVKYTSAGEYKYQFIIYKLTPELYYYARAQYLSYFDFLSNFGLTPPNFSYTNVKNGLGLVGGIAGTSSDWFDTPIPSSTQP